MADSGDIPAKPRRRHDQVLKSFFASPPCAQSFVRDFAARGWARELRLRSIRDLPTEHIGFAGQARRSDAAWRVPLRRGPGSVVFHVEFQSSVDRDMLARSLEYAAHLNRFFSRPGAAAEFAGPAPVVLSYVFYAGSRPWDAPRTAAELAPPGSPTLAALQAQHRYRVLDARSAPERDLPNEGTILRLLVDVIRDHCAMPQVVDALAKRYAGPEHAGVRAGFAAWAEEAMRALGQSEEAIGAAVEQIKNPREGGRMSWQVVEAVEEAREQGVVQGREQGLAEGVARGREQGTALMVRQAARKFGPETGEQLARILRSASAEAAGEVADAILDCETGDELLAKAANGCSVK